MDGANRERWRSVGPYLIKMMGIGASCRGKEENGGPRSKMGSSTEGPTEEDPTQNGDEEDQTNQNSDGSKYCRSDARIQRFKHL
jgi:hypothetical protein